ncbi:hypothetical protein [Desulfuromonas sp. DDH964]|uniref:hypothetical protein n=1 Tax=Desulfuromonas sp. DDH964 TaxID=1823759 RepID=UPI0009EDB691|nr:hypothetical protein [Desulfuromonas sp. DDH964]
MISQVLKTSIMSIGLGFLAQIFQSSLNTEYLNKFLEQNLITILIALLAINSATLGIVLTKIRDLVEKYGNASCFNNIKNHMVLSVKEQICLIIVSIIFLTLLSSNKISCFSDLKLLLDSITVGIFAYSLFVLYDTAKSVLIIIDFEIETDG